MACVLIIDEDGDTREALTELLIAWGIRVRDAACGSEAILHLMQETPALIVLDTWMPSTEANQFLDWLQANGELDDVPVVVTTADSGPAMHPRALAVLPKPYHLDRLLRLVREFSHPRHSVARRQSRLGAESPLG